MKKNKTCTTCSGAFSDHVLFPTLGVDNCIFYARALSTGTKHFSLWFVPRTFSLRKWDKIYMFSRALYQLHIGAWHWGCMCSHVWPAACFSVHSNSCMFFRNLVTSRRGPWERGWFPRLKWLAKSPSIVFLQMVMQCRIQLYPALHDHLSFASHFLHDSLWQFVSNSHYGFLVSNSPG